MNRWEHVEKSIPRKTNKRWFMLSLIFVLTAINYLDRTNMAVAASSMSAELGFNAVTMGMLLSAFAWAYAFMQVPGGYILEKSWTAYYICIVLVFWSFVYD